MAAFKNSQLPDLLHIIPVNYILNLRDSDPSAEATSLKGSIACFTNYDASTRFYGFAWYPDRLRWWMLHPTTGDKIVLWDYQGSPLRIPQNASRYRMNFWHTDAWSVETNPLSLEKPRERCKLEVDWMSYEPMKR